MLRIVCLEVLGRDSRPPFSLICKVPPEQSSSSSMLPFRSKARLMNSWFLILSVILEGKWMARPSSPHLNGSKSGGDVNSKSLKTLSKWMIPSLCFLLPIPSLSPELFRDRVSRTSKSSGTCSAPCLTCCCTVFFCFLAGCDCLLSSACLLALGGFLFPFPLPDIFLFARLS